MSRWKNALLRGARAVLWIAASSSLSCTSAGQGHGWMLMNRRDHPLTLWIRRTAACPEDADLGDEALFEDAERVTVKAQETIELSTSSSWYSGNDNQPQCGAVWLRSDEHPLERLLAWDHEPYWTPGANLTPYSVIFEGPRDRLVMHVPEEIDELPVPR